MLKENLSLACNGSKPWNLAVGKTLVTALLAVSVALIGCPPPAPEHINILDPKDLEAHDMGLVSGLASVPITIDLTSSSGQPLQVGSFQASVTRDLPGVGPEDVDEQGNPIEQPIDITSNFAVDYQAEIASLTTPVELSMGWYYLEAKVLDDLNVEASDLVFFSVDYPGPLFIGSTNSPYDLMHATLDGIYDECFNGLLTNFWEEDTLVITNVPTYLQVAAAPFGLPVEVQVPPFLDPSGTMTFRVYRINNALMFPAKAIPPIDLSPLSQGLVPCEIAFDLSGVLHRTGAESAGLRLAGQNVVIGDSPSGGSCWLSQPPDGCEMVVDLNAVAAYPPGG